jgi:hypothetical protein
MSSLPGTSRPEHQAYLLQEKCLKIFSTMGIENFSASND